MRLDKYMKVSRLIKRRSVAKDACDGSRIDLNGKPAKGAKEVKVGDIITIHYGDKALSVRIELIKDTVRKEEAKDMYTIIEG